MIHLRREQGKACAEERADCAVRGHGAVADVQVHVDQICDARDEDEKHARGHDNAGEDHRRPRDVRGRGPREPEEPNGNKKGAADH